MSDEHTNESNENTPTESTSNTPPPADTPSSDAEGSADAPVKKKRPSRRPTKKSTQKTTKKKTAKTTKKKVVKAKDSESAQPEAEPTTEPVAEPIAESVVEESKTEAESETSQDSSDTDTAEESKTTKKKTTRKKKTTKVVEKKPAASKPKDKEAKPPVVEMIVNYVPGEECRIAMLEDGKLEEFSVEPTDQVSRVGNIYVGRVANIEQSIQAAFIDFGTEENGFLHLSDLHPQYFAKGDDKTEQVGKKTPRKSRPPIQNCLRKGQEIIVQVLKEGVGTKGPSLTSYLSIPGRFLVMMPGMDKVGVSRKEEDDDKRRAAREILAQLELPQDFGFILRTAGFDRTKAELKRDLSYLQRLWKDMEKRRKIGSKSKPKLLYTESDLLMRSIRDLLTSEVSRVVIDSESALKRVANFVKIAAPRSGTKLAHYVGTRPIFHAFEIEPQIEEIHAREVHLPSGGRLVIDQTEALVAIDVNSGKSRGAKDAESNAFQTNLEAVDAICRQLRLRDLGGLVVNDLIDMRYHSHRKEIEQRFRDRLKRDRAKSTIAPISPFGLLEMTRQRMRGSMESQHFADCPMCHGRGLVQRPDSVAASALRDLAALIDYDSVHRAELVVNSRVAGSLLSTKRRSLTRIELASGKSVDVRVSDSLPADRFAFYAYDAHGADISIERLKPSRKSNAPSVVDWLDTPGVDGSWAIDPLDEADGTTAQQILEELAKAHETAAHTSSAESIDLSKEEDDDSGEGTKKKRRRRRRGKRSGRSGDSENATETANEETENTSEPVASEDDASSETESENGEGTTKKRRRRRRGGRGRSRSSETQNDDAPQRESDRPSDESAEPAPPAQERIEASADGAPKSRKPRRRPPKPGTTPSVEPAAKPAARPAADEQPKADRPVRKKKPAPKRAAESTSPAPEPKPARKGQYAKAGKKLSASEIAKLGISP